MSRLLFARPLSLEWLHKQSAREVKGYKREDAEKLALIYLSKSDDSAFVYSLDEVWKLAGYSRKDIAKRAIFGSKLQSCTGEGLKRGEEVKIFKYYHENENKKGITKTKTEVKNEETKNAPPPPRKRVRRQHGGHNREDIRMTRFGLVKFLLSGRTPASTALALFLVKLGCAHLRALSDPEVVLPSSYYEEHADAHAELLSDLATCQAATGAKTLHDQTADRLALEHGGRREVVLSSGSRPDVVTDAYVIEVKPSREWMHGLGQAQAYAEETGLEPYLFLIGQPSELAKTVCRSKGVKLGFCLPSQPY